MERNYYLVDPNGKSMVAIKEWQEITQKAQQAAYDLATEYGADQVWKTHESIMGFHFTSDPGRWWKASSDQEGVYVPDKRTTAGKTIAKKMEAIRIPGTKRFAEIIGGGYFIILKDRRVSSISFEVVNDHYIISMPKREDVDESGNDELFVPPDTTLLKPSEYYALKGE